MRWAGVFGLILSLSGVASAQEAGEVDRSQIIRPPYSLSEEDKAWTPPSPKAEPSASPADADQAEEPAAVALDVQEGASSSWGLELALTGRQLDNTRLGLGVYGLWEARYRDERRRVWGGSFSLGWAVDRDGLASVPFAMTVRRYWGSGWFFGVGLGLHFVGQLDARKEGESLWEPRPLAHAQLGLWRPGVGKMGLELSTEYDWSREPATSHGLLRFFIGFEL